MSPRAAGGSSGGPRRSTHRSSPAQAPLRSRAAGSRARPKSAGKPAPRATSKAGTRPAAPRKAPSRRAPQQTDSRLAVWLGLGTPARGLRPPVAPGFVRGRRRYAVVYDLDGPRVRLGVAWFLLVLGALVIERLVVGAPLLVLVYGAAAGVAAAQVARSHVDAGAGVDPRLAAALAVTVSASSLLGARFVGLVILAAVGVALADSWMHASRQSSVLGDAGITLQAALVPAAAAVGVALTLRYEIGAAVVLILLVSVFDLGDFLVGSGAASVIEGPLAGTAAVAVVTAIVAVLNVPPFGGAWAWAFGAGAAVLCPAGQVLASAILPDGMVRSPALRRLDSLLLLAPLWAWAIAVPLARTH